MGLDLDNLTTNSATCRVDFGAAGDVNVVYRPGNVTENSLAKLQYLQEVEAQRKADPERSRNLQEALEYMQAINMLLQQVVIEWDMNRKGVIIPLTEEGLSGVPLDVRARVLSNIFGDAGMDPTNGTPSQPTSPAISVQEANTSSGKQGNRASRRSSRKSK